MATTDFSEARLNTLAFHKVGNKVKGIPCIPSSEVVNLDNEYIVDGLEEYFLRPFKADQFYRFSDIDSNIVYQVVRSMFNDSFDNWIPRSIELMQHLFELSTHPAIKSGGLFVAHFRECLVDGVTLNAIGIFKVEQDDYFIKVEGYPANVKILPERGIHDKTKFKGCLIFDTYAEDGYTAMIVDNDANDAMYWRDEFLKLARIPDDNWQTSGFIQLTSEFVADEYSRSRNKQEQVVLMAKALDYLKQREAFDLEEFKNEVIPKHASAFQEYVDEVKSDMGIAPDDGFAISKPAVTKAKAKIKPVIRLDTDVEIRFTGKEIEQFTDHVQREFDPKQGMFYYKVYFREEI